MNARIRDVAELAGVSVSTVTHTLNGKRPVAPETQRRVRAAIQQLNYTPNRTAQSLVHGNNQIIGMLYPTPLQTQDHAAQLIMSAARAANDQDYSFLLVSRDDQEYLKQIINGNFVDGLLVMNVLVSDARIQLLKEQRFPFVCIGRADPSILDGVDYIDSDMYGMGVMAADHLLALGHQRIAFLGQGPKGMAFTQYLYQGYQEGLAHHRVCIDPRLVEYALPTFEDSYRGMQTILEQSPPCTAVFLGSEMLAPGAFKAMAEAGLAIPDDVSVIAHGHASFAMSVNPPLSMVETEPSKLSSLAVDILLGRLKHRNRVRSPLVVPGTVVKRASSAAIRT